VELKAKNKTAYQKDPKKRCANQWVYDIKRMYGMSVEQCEALLIAQDGHCAVCGADKPGRGHAHFSVDHKHVDGYEEMSAPEKLLNVRGLLCHGCNNGNGITDNPALLRAKADYLERGPLFK